LVATDPTPLAGADRILQVDEDSGGTSGTGVPRYRLVDLSLQQVVALPPIPVRTIGASDGKVVVSGSDGLLVLDADARQVKALGAPWLTGAAGARQLGPIVADPDAALTPTLAGTLQAADPAPNPRSPGGASGPGRWLLPAVATLILGPALLVQRREAQG
jgi:hypothetical protein